MTRFSVLFLTVPSFFFFLAYVNLFFVSVINSLDNSLVESERS